MNRAIPLLLSIAWAAAADNFAAVSAASASAGLAPESLASAYGKGFAAQTMNAGGQPWPASLAGVTVLVRDSANVERPAGLLFVSPSQINFEVPAGTAPGPATVAIGNALTAAVQIQAVAPALFTVNDSGLAAASAIRAVIPTHIQSPVTVFQCGATAASCRAVPLDVGLDAPVYLSFYGTGIRGRSSLDHVKVQIGTMSVDALYAGPQPQIAGLDQVNVPLPLGLRGSGEVNVTLTVDGVASNPVKIAIQ